MQYCRFSLHSMMFIFVMVQTLGSSAQEARPAVSHEQGIEKRLDTLVLEDFRSFASDAELAKQWHGQPWGSWMRQSLEPNINAQGKLSLKYEYRFSAEKGKDFAAIYTTAKWDLSDYGELQFWLKPDGQGREVTVQFNVAGTKGNNTHDLWEANYATSMGDTSPRIVTIPFAQLHHVSFPEGAGRSPVFAPARIIEFAVFLGAGSGPIGKGALYFDDFMAVREGAQQASFSELADLALMAMREHAAKIGITGVALVAHFVGDDIQSWESKMIVMRKRKDPPTANASGVNLLAIAYAKAAEAADSLKPSGNAGRPLMTGEYGWQGSVIRKAGDGYWIAAFSGGKSEEDVEVSKTGLASILKTE